MSEIVEDWECGVCGAPLGKHSRGIKIECPTCGERLCLPGFDKMPSQSTIEFLASLKEQAKRHAQEDYEAMRER